MLIAAGAAAVLVGAAAAYFATRPREKAAPPAAASLPSAAAPTPALEFPEPKMGQGETAAAPAPPACRPDRAAAGRGAPAPAAAASAEPAAGRGSDRGTAPSPSSRLRPPKKYRVQFSSVPVATLSIDGKKIGPSIPARTLQLEEGSHTVRFEAKGFPVHERTIQVAADTSSRIHYQFPVSMLVIEAPAWAGARLLIDGKYRGNLPDASPVKLPPGSYNVTLSREGVSPVTEKIRVPEGAEKKWNPPPPSPAATGGTP